MSDVEAVLEFLRRNGLTEAVTALKEDMVERSQGGAFDFESFLFPIPPPVKIPATLRRSEEEEKGELRTGSGSNCEDDEEFVSLGSSASGSGNCSSEFVNPYGLHSASQNNSDTSSDNLSQFGTAREYIQNDYYWNEEKDEDDFFSPIFNGPDFFSCQTEDKFITTSEFEDPMSLHQKSEEYQMEGCVDYFDKPCVFNMVGVNGENGIQDKRRNFDEKMENGFDYGGFYDQDPNSFLFKMRNGDDWLQGFKCSSDFTQKKSETDHFLPDIIDSFGAEDAEENGELDSPKAAADGEVNDTDDLAMYNSHEDEYEVFNLRIIHRKNRTGFEENKEFPIMLNSVIAGRYYVTEYLGSAAFSRVVQAQDLKTGIDVCLKIIKNDKDFFDQSLDEIKLLKLVNKHDPADEHHILRLYDYFYCQEHLFIVCELLRANLYEFQKFNQESGGEAYFSLSRLQTITRQCLEALCYLHDLGIIHCDLKPENILIKSYSKCEIKIIDLGSSCFQTDNLCLYVQSRSYRAPEVILGLPYDEKIDLWSLGCILAELYSGEVLFPNDGVVMILARMIGLLGPIDMEMLVKGEETHKYFTEEFDLYHMNEETDQIEYVIPEESSLEHHLEVSDVLFVDFIRHLLEINPRRRPTAREALEHPWLSHLY